MEGGGGKVGRAVPAGGGPNLARAGRRPPAGAGRRFARRGRAPLLALGLVALFAGLWGGLLRLGLRLPGGLYAAGELHGPLMALGFLGTLISLERAVALGSWWAYAAPIGAGAGALVALADPSGSLAPVLVTFAGLVLVADHLVLQRLAPSPHNVVMGLGALAWLGAGLLWATGADVSRFVPLLAGFLVLTIVGERLELTRARRLATAPAVLFAASAGVFCGGVAVSVPAPTVGIRIAGLGLLGLAAWLARYDVARRTVRIGGVTRYMAGALLLGYVWLVVAGVLWTKYAATVDGAAYDASLHAVFLGFVLSMVFAHAPVIVPAVLRVPLPFSRRLYLPLALLQLSLALRLIGGDLAGDRAAWQWGGARNEVAILLFLALVAVSVVGARKGRVAEIKSQPIGLPPRQGTGNGRFNRV